MALSLFPNLPYQFLDIEWKSSSANAGLHSDHRERRDNLEDSIIWFATMQPGRDQSPGFTHDFQHLQHRYSDENRADIRLSATNALIEIDGHRELLNASERLRISLHRPSTLEICGINGGDWIIFRSSTINKNIENRGHCVSDYPTLFADIGLPKLIQWARTT